MQKPSVAREPYILGLDIGVASVGWCRIGCDPADSFKPLELLAAGAHLFEPGTEGSVADIDKGKDSPRNLQRRTARLMRRQIWRRARRKRVLLQTLIRIGLLPKPETLGLDAATDLRRPLDIDGYMKRLDVQLVERWMAVRRALGAGGHADQQRLCYLLREAAASSKVEKVELGRALYHLAQRRGFLSNRRADAGRKDDETGIVKASISELAQKMEAFVAAGGIPTLGAYLASLDPDVQRLRGRWTARSMYLDEFELIWKTQTKAHGLTEADKREVHRAIFHQRPLKSQAGMIGHCTLIPALKRCPLAHRLNQRFRLLQAVNHLQIAAPSQPPRILTLEERETLIAALEREGDLTFDKVRKLLGFKRGTEFNLERGDEKRIIGNRTDAKLRKVFGDRLDSFGDGDRDRMVEDLRSFREAEALKRRGQRRWGLTPEQAAAFTALDVEDGYASLSIAAIRRLLPGMERGLPYAVARREEFPESFRSVEAKDSLPPAIEALADLRNPAVARALTEVRKLVNEATRRFGKPTLIRVELAREIKNPRGVREKLTRQMRDREKQRAGYAAMIEKEVGITNPSRDDIAKWLLAEECGWTCPYTGRQISPTTLLGRHPQFDIEHIWPKSRSLDDSLANKTLCYHEENRARKRGMTPFEAYGGDPVRWEEILTRVRAFKGDLFTRVRKLEKFQNPAPDFEGFTNRHLSDTRFIARAAADYLGLLYGGRIEHGTDLATPGTQRVQVTSGGLTAWLRSGWGIASLLGDTGEKTRADHRHHAIDAIVVALSDPRAVQALARAATEADRLGKRRAFEEIEEPWQGFRDSVAQAIERIIVSHRQSRKVTGPLHDQSIYSKPFASKNAKGQATHVHRIRKELHKLTPPEIRGDKIIDPRARALIRAKLEALGKPNPTPQDIAKIFTDPANAPMLTGHAGTSVRLRKVRVLADAGRMIGSKEEGTDRWILPSSNHHSVIVEVRNAKGRTRWEDRPVALLDAYARLSKKLPIVDRTVASGERFLFSLSPGEFVEIDLPDDPPKRAVCRVLGTSKGRFDLKLHSDGRTSSEVRSSGERWRPSAEILRTLRARKVRVTYLGEVLNAGG